MKKVIATIALLGCLTACSRQRAEVQTRARRQEQKVESRRVFPHSLIPGGIESNGELQANRRVDGKLAEHYKGIGTNLTLTKMKADTWHYASYRTADGIYWTKKKILVHEGEAVLTDGENMVRGRCGNRLAENAQAAVRKFEPPDVGSDEALPEAFAKMPDTPPDILLKAPNSPVFPELQPGERPSEPSAQKAEAPAQPTTPTALGLGRGPGVLIVSAPVAPTHAGRRAVTNIFVPEPGTWMTLFSGLAMMVGATWIKRRSLGICSRKAHSPDSAPKPIEHSVECSRS